MPTLEPSANRYAIDQSLIAFKKVHIEFWGYRPGVINMKPVTYPRPEREVVFAISVFNSRPEDKSQTLIGVDKNKPGKHKRIEVPPDIFCHAAQADQIFQAVLIIYPDCEPVFMTLFSISKK